MGVASIRRAAQGCADSLLHRTGYKSGGAVREDEPQKLPAKAKPALKSGGAVSGSHATARLDKRPRGDATQNRDITGATEAAATKNDEAQFRARGGRTRHAPKVNVLINAGGQEQAKKLGQQEGLAAGAKLGAAAVVRKMAPPPGPPPGGGMPPMPPGAGAPPMPPGQPPMKRGGSIRRASGGEVDDEEWLEHHETMKPARERTSGMDTDERTKKALEDTDPKRARGGSIPHMTAGAGGAQGRLDKARLR